MTMRLDVDKVRLHDDDCAHSITSEELASADRRVVVRRNERREPLQIIARQHLGQEERGMNFQRADAAWDRILGDLGGAGGGEVQEAQAELPHDLER